MKHIILFFSMLCFVYANDLNSLEDSNEQLEKLQRDCLKYGNDKSFDNFKKTAETCYPGLKEYMIKMGSKESFVDHYCRVMPKLARCATKIMKALEQCLSPEDRDSLNDYKTMPFTIVNFICYKERRRSNMFFTNEGVKCISSSSNEIEKCIKNTFPGRIPEQGLLTNKLGEQECKKIEDVQNCAVREMRNCPNQMYASYLDELMTELRRATPCHKYMSTNSRLTFID